MKKLLVFLILIAFGSVTFLGCSGGNGGNSGGPGGDTTDFPGQSSTYTVGGISFNMRYAPSGSFTSDDRNIFGDTVNVGPVTVANAYWIAETEVTWELWTTVFTWATDDARGSNKYTFANSGAGVANRNPVTNVSWRDAMVWCNALTEYYDGNSNNCVYYSDASFNTPIRSVNNGLLDTTAGLQDNPYVKLTAQGFRLPTSDEWQLAARYKNGADWTPSNYVSGDTTGPCWTSNGQGVSTVFGNYAWYSVNSALTTHPVGEKIANALNLRDMSGNVREWCFDWLPLSSSRILRGASYGNPAEYQRIGIVDYDTPDRANITYGLRPVRTQ